MVKKKQTNKEKHYTAEIVCYNCNVRNSIIVERTSLVKDYIRLVSCSCVNCGFRLK